MIEGPLRTRLKTGTNVFPITTNIEWDERPERSTYPALVMETVIGQRDQHMSGFAGFQSTTVQFNCFATKKSEAAALREAVITDITPEASVGGTDFLRAQDIIVRQAPKNTTSDFVFCEIVEATLWHN